jgi:hypothetical protein
MNAPRPDLDLVARQNRQVIDELGALRRDLAALLAIVRRMDGTVSRFVSEIRATSTQYPAGRM